jgi:hypothetical protein
MYKNYLMITQPFEKIKNAHIWIVLFPYGTKQTGTERPCIGFLLPLSQWNGMSIFMS